MKETKPTQAEKTIILSWEYFLGTKGTFLRKRSGNWFRILSWNAGEMPVLSQGIVANANVIKTLEENASTLTFKVRAESPKGGAA